MGQFSLGRFGVGQFSPRSVRIAALVSVGLVVLGVTVSNASRPAPRAQPVTASRVAPGAATVEQTETADLPTPTPTPSPSPSPSATPAAPPAPTLTSDDEPPQEPARPFRRFLDLRNPDDDSTIDDGTADDRRFDGWRRHRIHWHGQSD